MTPQDTDSGADEEAGRRGHDVADKGAENQDVVARLTTLGLHIVEDVIYALTALVLVAGALLLLGAAVYHLVAELHHGTTKAIEATLNSLLIVFILVELLSAVRAAIDEHQLVAEPFLLVGILALIKEMVVLATFRIEAEKASDTAIKLGVLGGVVIGLAVATLVLRRREREPKETGDTSS